MRCQRLSPAWVQWRPSAARGSSAALGRSVCLRPAGGARVSGAGLMIDRPAPETKSGVGAVAALGRQGALYTVPIAPPTNRRSQVLCSDWFIENRGGA